MNYREPKLRRKKRGGLTDEIHTWTIAIVVFVVIVIPFSFIVEWLI